MAGYDVETVDVVKENLRCSLCRKILRDAMQTGGGLHTCEICYEEAKAKSQDKSRCPVDNSPNAMVFADKYARRQVESLKVFCKNKRMGCGWVNELKALEHHLQYQCQFNFPPVPEQLASPIASKTNSKLMLEVENLKKELFTQSQKNIQLERDLNEMSTKYKSQQDEINSVKQLLHGRIPGSETHAVLDDINRGLSELQLNQSIMENVNYDGRSIWKITNVAQRMNRAEISKALHSAPCYTNKYGYKFCTRLYLNGDGAGKGSHVSIFFVLMQSEYDALLQWPFTGRITFKLLNPTDLKASVVETICLEKFSDSNRRPDKTMNMAVGVPLFMDKNELQGRRNYVLDDSIYVETIVELM